jgi:hypothetical protein
MSELNDQVIAEFRANGSVVRGALGGKFKDIHCCFSATSEGVAARSM